ncbi:MAG: hypothetical protein HRT74_06005 [Flavobacteriales bacterium]|nr:hypothetical protein [Flavobacteriales bacterium]
MSNLFTGCSARRANRLMNESYKEWKEFQWTEVKRDSKNDSLNWTIYSRKEKESNLTEYKIIGEISSSPNSCLSEFRKEIYKQANAENNRKYPTYSIIKESTDSILTYVIHMEPFPLKNTEMLVQYVFSLNESGSSGVKWEESWDEYSVDESKRLDRIALFRCSWNFEEVFENQVMATNIVQFDPKGMPKALYQPMVLNFLKKALKI